MNAKVRKIRKAVIPVAGLGTRFLPATKAIPKEMIPIVDVPMIQINVEEAVRAGIEEIIFVTARHKEAIENHFDHNYELEDRLNRSGKEDLARISERLATLCKIVCIRQGEPLGLGHAVLSAAPAVGDEPFAVLLGDDLIDSEVPCIGQLISVFEKENRSVVGVMEVAASEVSKYGIVGGNLIRPGVTQVSKVVEKPRPADAPSRLAIPGRYVLSPGIFKLLRELKPGKGGEIQLTDALEALAASEGLLAAEFEGVRYDTGDKLGFLDATLAFALKRSDLAPALVEMMKKHLKQWEKRS